MTAIWNWGNGETKKIYLLFFSSSNFEKGTTDTKPDKTQSKNNKSYLNFNAV